MPTNSTNVTFSPDCNDEPSNKSNFETITIEAKNLTVLSLSGQVLIGPLTFTIADKAHIAIVGQSGAGKTTLLNALLGFLPYKGTLLINGIELSVIDKDQLRQKLAWLGQEPQLFYGTLKDNVALGNIQLSDAEIKDLLKQACIEELINTPQGLNYVIGENGQGLSVGQAQRVALARALALNPALYLLDEPTASLDIKSEQLVQQALSNASYNKTLIMVSHRLDLLQKNFTVWVMDKGQIVEQGDYQSLKQANGLFANMLKQSDDDAWHLAGVMHK